VAPGGVDDRCGGKKQISADADTAPVFSASELKRARRVVPTPAAADVRRIRQRLGLSQEKFTALRLLGGDHPQLRAGHRTDRTGARPA